MQPLPIYPNTVTRAFPSRRFILFILLSLALHAVLFSLPQPSSTTPHSIIRELEVRFAAPAERTILPAAEKPSTRKTFSANVPPAPATKREHPAAVTTKLHDPTPYRELDTQRMPVRTSTPNTVSITALMESARKIARETGSVQSSQAQAIANVFERPILPQLARALRREPPGETRLANGMIKVVTTTGAIYCLQALPKFAQGGPVEPMIIPTNCPS